jgi:hypothetical protein
VPALWSQVDRLIARFIGDGIVDHAPVSPAVEHHSSGARVIIPPRQDAVVSSMATMAPTQRDQQVLAIENAGQCAWKRTSGYDAQRHAENAFSRCKRTFGGVVRSKREASQERDASLACGLLHRLRQLGCPPSSPVR